MTQSDEDALPKHIARNKGTSESKLRRSPKHCPICLAPLEKNNRRTKLMQHCESCRGNVSPGKACQRCAAEAIWENKQSTACRSCGNHGKKAVVIAGS